MGRTLFWPVAGYVMPVAAGETFHVADAELDAMLGLSAATEALIRGVRLQRTDLIGAHLAGVNLVGVQIDGVFNLDRAYSDARTQLRAGYSRPPLGGDAPERPDEGTGWSSARQPRPSMSANRI